MTGLKFFAGLASAMLAATPAAAERSPAGSWVFQTDEMPDSCLMSGEMTISAAHNSKGFTCTFAARQTCRDRLPREIRTLQTCTASRVRDQITIVSQIERIESVDPSSLRPNMEERYAPDNFAVALNAAGDVMVGMFSSWGRIQSRAQFDRREPSVS